MSDNNVVEGVVKKHLPNTLTIGAWILIILICMVSLVLSGLAYQRSKLDNTALRSISQITERLERTAATLQGLAENSGRFNQSQSEYLYNSDRNLKGGYDVLTQKYGDGTTTTDDGSSKWLFSQDDGKRSQ